MNIDISLSSLTSLPPPTSLSLSLPPFLFLSLLSLSFSLQDDEVRDRLQKAMRGEIAVGSYSPLPTRTQRNKMSTSPASVRRGQRAMIQTGEVVARRGQGGVVQRRNVESERPISSDTEKLAVEPATLATSDLFGERRGVRKERHKSLYKESSVDREEREDKNITGCGEEREDKNITGCGVEAEGGALDEMGGVLQVPICRRENSRLRELLKAIESYDRYMYIIIIMH